MTKNGLASVLIWLTPILIGTIFLCLLSDIILQGLPRLSWSYLLEAPQDAGRAGGIAPIIVATGLILLVAIAAAAPLGLATAVLLTEFTRSQRFFDRFIERSLDVLASIPSIVFGLFGNAFFCIYLGLGFSILSGGLTLACMALPILIRTTMEGLRAAPDDYRLSAAALGMSRAATLWHLLLPSASPALAAGLMLAIGRAGAETAALIFTSGYVDRMPSSLSDSGRALSVHIYDLSMNVAGGDANAHAAALVLILILLSLNAMAMSLTQRWLHRRIVTS
ncbi:phosphate ABC transporter permease PstA [Methylomarinum sp. Ch1-1]|uniref:Phosphate transport system permease protein PstA n=1 Tax=Methylomarinum roseum TaxID=3067653 RepID=A0AAU7NZH9_9GAMM|nr:phosphate ABC transporter permease PstA [Methylomarinum sp. Ch1-1]MDP4521461.1 phosphate ABC transporter permease PstA [Methylomarinum sp. Ch1-1]